MTRGLKFRIYEVEGSYCPCSENKGADQLRGYREADLRLCFRICKKPVFSRRGSFIFEIICFYLVVALFDLVHDMKAIFSPSLAANNIWKCFLKYE